MSGNSWIGVDLDGTLAHYGSDHQPGVIYHLGKELPITASKDYSMVELWDDRAVQVIPNTGERADGKE